MGSLLLFDDTPAPAFDAQFLSGVLPAGLTYTNSSTTRTYFGADGLLKTAAANAPIFEYNPVTLAMRGMRWEMEQRTNLLLHSADFTNAAWVKARASISANVATAPDGTNTADKLVEDTTASNTHLAYQHVSGITASSAAGTHSIFLKAAERASVRVYWMDQLTIANSVSALINLSNGTASAITSAGTYSGAAVVITALADGWYKVALSGVKDTSTFVEVRIVLNNGTSDSYTGDGVSGVYLWGAQLELSASASSYIPTAAAAVTRQPDVLTASSISWYRQDEGTVLFEGISNRISADATTSGMWQFSDGTDANRIIGRRLSGNNADIAIVAATALQCAPASANTLTTGQPYRTAHFYKTNNFGLSLNGGTISVDPGGAIPTVNSLRFGQGNSGTTQPFMGYARRFQYFNTRLPNAQIQGMSRV